MSIQSAISLMVLSGDRIFADALALVLFQEGLRVTAVAALGGETALDLPEVDVILIDAAGDRGAALAASWTLRERALRSHRIVIGLEREDEGILEFVQAGVGGYVLQEASPANLVAAIRAVHEGQTFCSPRIAAAALANVRFLLAEAQPAEQVEPAPGALTQRELELLSLIAQGMGNKEIGRALQISVQTVKNHVHNILDKLHAKRRREAVRLGYERGLLREPLDLF